MTQEKIYVISLGGSLIVPAGGIDWKFLKKFRQLIIERIKDGDRFIIVTGGGRTCRDYQQAASKVMKLTDDDRDWLGIHTTRLNAHLIKTIFRDYAHPRINKNPNTKEDLNKHFKKGEGLMVAAGWRPGFSTDHDAVVLAKRLGAKTIINLSNISHVYDKDPKKFKDARKIENISWSDFRKIVGDKWDPGLNAPFDPIASREAHKLGMEIVIMNGKNLANLKDCLAGKKCVGTIIK
ncbi:MAG: UMP kinase [Patescibacteria group bacterium]|jgi:uridylate kinase